MPGPSLSSTFYLRSRRAAITDVDGRLVTSDNPLRTSGFYTVWFTSTMFGKPFERFTADRVAEFDLTNFWTWVTVANADLWNDSGFDIKIGRVQDRPYISVRWPKPRVSGALPARFPTRPKRCLGATVLGGLAQYPDSPRRHLVTIRSRAGLSVGPTGLPTLAGPER